MTIAKVKQLFIHPIKGLTPQECDRVYMQAGHGIRGDRAFALMFVKSGKPAPPDALPWMSKKHFAVQNDWPLLAALNCHYDQEIGQLTIKIKQRQIQTETERETEQTRETETEIVPEIEILRPRIKEDELLLVANTNTAAGRDRISAFFTGYLASIEPTESAWYPLRSQVQLVGTNNGKTRYPDREAGHISLVNQATLDQISEVCGTFVDARRFRPNIVLEGIPPWAEFDWVGQEFQIGECRIGISARIGRCLNIEVNPETGDRDIPLYSLIKEHFGHIQTGVVATVITGGNVSHGDTLDYAELTD